MTSSSGKSSRGVKRNLLRQAVEDNVRTIEGRRSRVHRPRRITSRALWLAATAGILALGAYWIPRALGLAGTESDLPVVVASADPGSAILEPVDPAAIRWSSHSSIPGSVFPVAVRKIVLDPGHGGRDGGSSTTAGLVEKELTLDIAQRLKALLSEGEAFEVLMTRESDEFVVLKDRARLANEAEADLFLSIHLNWLEPVTQRGVETFYLGPTEDPHLVELTRRENLESGYSLADMRSLLDGIYLDLRHEQSRRLAMALQKSLFQEVALEGSDVRDRGAKAAPFLVLVTTEMPAVLAEVSALSNASDVELLENEDYRQRIASSLHRGLVRYIGGLMRP
ncbi:MAG: N-acetylmuramoyl-L-alanine amidase [Thermoanaerobaculia bacterium]|nr:N-acetylmuramoyl-L-alanine amidase [Thermoanaerobaculia bacterium]